MVKSNTEDTELQALHSYNIDVKNREIFLHSHFGYDEDESGVDYRSSVCFEKNLRFLNQQSCDNILVHMHIPGGDWEDCLSMYDTIRYSKAKTTILGYAKVQSASSIIFQAANTRILMPNVNMLIHYGSISIDDEHKAAISSLQWSERESAKLLDIFVDKWMTSPMSKEKNWKKPLAKKHIQGQLATKSDWILTAEESVYYGFADGILGDKKYPTIESLKK